MKAKKGDFIRIKSDYYFHLQENVYQVTNVEPVGVFIKGYEYIILHSDYEIVNQK